MRRRYTTISRKENVIDMMYGGRMEGGWAGELQARQSVFQACMRPIERPGCVVPALSRGSLCRIAAAQLQQESCSR